MSNLSDHLLEVNDRNTRDDVAEQLGGYFEDVLFTLESIEDMFVVPQKIKSKIRKIRKDISTIQHEINKEF